MLGQRIKQERLAKNWTQGQLADKCGVSTAMVSVWERGGSLPQGDKRAALQDVLGLDDSDFDSPPPPRIGQDLTWDERELLSRYQQAAPDVKLRVLNLLHEESKGDE